VLVTVGSKLPVAVTVLALNACEVEPAMFAASVIPYPASVVGLVPPVTKPFASYEIDV
jgi:hypothetical protein